MKTLLFYRPNAEGALVIRDYQREFTFRTGRELPTVDIDTPEGIELCQVYDIVKYPTLLAVDDQGRELQRWDGEMLPPMSEVGYFSQET